MFFYTFLPKLINMSLTASVAIAFVLLLRLPLRKAPKVISYALWGVVLFRLLCPVSVASDISMFNLFDAPTAQSGGISSTMEYVPVDIVHREYPEVTLPIPGASEAVNETLPQGEEQLRADPLEAPMAFATYVWMAGVAAMAGYSAVTYTRLKRMLLAAVPLRDNIYLADEIASPFVLGLVRPRIYLPSSLEERERGYIILHEQHHIRRLDHIVKALAFAALCVHWFNPLVWLAFILSGKDMEMSCDEAVIKKLGAGVRADYTASLLSLATGKRIIAGVPLAFGEGDTKGRIKNLANWKKPAFWVVLLSVLACIALAVGLLTNPANGDDSPTEGAYYLRIGAEGVTYIEASAPNTGGGAIHADGSPFELGEEVWLEMLDGVTDLRGVSVTALDGDGEIVYALSIPQSATDGEIVNAVAGDGWLLAPAAALEYHNFQGVREWFNYLDSPSDMPWEDTLETETDAFPGVTFRWTPEEMTAENENGTTLLFTGMPIWNAYFADISGDGLPEICATTTFGSGIIDSRIVVHDYIAGETYELEDRGFLDYELRMDGDKLTAVQYEHNGERVGVGIIEIIENENGEKMLSGIWSPVAAEAAPAAPVWTDPAEVAEAFLTQYFDKMCMGDSDLEWDPESNAWLDGLVVYNGLNRNDILLLSQWISHKSMLSDFGYRIEEDCGRFVSLDVHEISAPETPDSMEDTILRGYFNTTAFGTFVELGMVETASGDYAIVSVAFPDSKEYNTFCEDFVAYMEENDLPDYNKTVYVDAERRQRQEALQDALGINSYEWMDITTADVDGSGDRKHVIAYVEGHDGGYLDGSRPITLVSLSMDRREKAVLCTLNGWTGYNASLASLPSPDGGPAVLCLSQWLGGTMEQYRIGVLQKGADGSWRDTFAEYGLGLDYSIDLLSIREARLTYALPDGQRGQAMLDPSVGYENALNMGEINADGSLTDRGRALKPETFSYDFSVDFTYRLYWEDGALSLHARQYIEGFHKLDRIGYLNSFWRYKDGKWTAAAQVEPAIPPRETPVAENVITQDAADGFKDGSATEDAASEAATGADLLTFIGGAEAIDRYRVSRAISGESSPTHTMVTDREQLQALLDILSQKTVSITEFSGNSGWSIVFALYAGDTSVCRIQPADERLLVSYDKKHYIVEYPSNISAALLEVLG